MIRFAGTVLLCTLAAAGQAAPAVVQRHFDRAQAALAAGQYEAAASEFNSILKLDPNRAEIHANLGTVYYALGRYADASALFQSARSLKRALKGLDAFQGMALAREGRNVEARPLLEKGFNDPASSQWRLECGLLLAEIYQQTRESPKLLGVIATLQQEYPRNSEVLYLAYRVYSSLGARAVAALVKEAPDSARLRQIAAELLEADGDFGAAVEQYRRALELEPKLPGAHRALGVALMNRVNDQDTRKEAQELFLAELALNPGDAYSEYQIGELMWLENRQAEALQRFQKALELQPNFPDACMGAAKALTASGELKQAVSLLEKATELDPLNEVVHYRLAQVFQKMGDRSRAQREIAEFQRLRQAQESLRAIHKEVVETQRITSQRVE